MARRVVFALVVLALAIPATAGAATGRSPRIVGGVPVTTANLPFAAGFQIALSGVGGDEPDALCSGSLIAARWVLTAAHCLAEDPVDRAHSFVVLGATNLDAATPDQQYGIADGGYPKAYETNNGGYDVGLLQLSRPAPEAQVRLARPSETALLAGGRPALTAGWGLTEDRADGGTFSSNQLRQVDLSLYSDQDCSNAFASVGHSSTLSLGTEICALSPGKDSCNGDSGGPLLTADGSGQPVLIGATSFGVPGTQPGRDDRSCNEGPPGVYALVGANPLNAFIRSIVPQVEIDSDVAVPVPGETVKLTAQPKAPGASGPFGGYDHLAWDLNGDGNFAEALDTRSVSVPAADGATTVSVRATDAAGDNEVRTLRLISQNKSALAFAKAGAKVKRGHTAKVKVNRIGAGAGTVRVRVSGHGVTPSPRKLTITGSEPSVTVKLRARRSASSKVTVSLSSFSGNVIAGTRSKLTLKTHR